MPELNLSNVVNVTLLGTPTSLAATNINTAALFSSETPLEAFGDNDYKIYVTASEVATDWGSASKAAKCAAAYFSQQPNPLVSGGYLVIIPLADGGTEKVEAAIVRIGETVYYFGILVDGELSGADFAALATAVQAIDKVLFYASRDQADYAITTGIFDNVREAAQTHVRCLFYDDDIAGDEVFFAAGYAGRALSTNFAGSRTTQTLHLKTIVGFVSDVTIDQTELVKVQAAGVDVQVNIGGITALFTSGENGFWDEVYNELWFKFALQIAGFNYLRTTNTKIPQTETGIEGLKGAYRKICEQAVSNGFVGAGTWTSPDTFGDPEALIRCVKDNGYYVYSQPISEQATVDRTARKAPLIQIAVKSQGAVHSTALIVNVNI